MEDQASASEKRRATGPALNEPEAPLTVGGVLRRGWFLFTVQGWKQLGAGVLGAIPLALIFAITLTVPVIVSNGDGGSGGGGSWWIGLLVFDMVFTAFLPLLLGVNICLTAAAHAGEEITIVRAYRRVVAHYGQLLLSFLAVYLGTALGLLLFVVPGVWFSATYGLAWIIVPLEKCSAGDALARSRSVLTGRRTPFLLLQGLFLVLLSVVTGVFILVIFLTGDTLTTNAAAQFFTLFIVMEVNILLFIPYIPVLAAFYFDCIQRQRDGDGVPVVPI